MPAPIQGKITDNFGDWPIRYRAIPCPVGKLTMRFQFLDFRKPVRNSHHTPLHLTGFPRIVGLQALNIEYAFRGKPERRSGLIHSLLELGWG